ncbi:putative late blight resistance protein homolog R1A-3 [Olea europaea var. sylvestris]|uniref:putative late blight resistance protein homolog R1A-3 n=1 Tax=Olea europaea var. sylvestris TaxID=158386 RepID=UPI000C1D4668|nr:putative late blight resistance protein homolog R1A-3 [Olea europaea var. sylvestris]
MRSLNEKVNFFVDFLDVISPKSSENISDLEGRIRDAAYEAEDIFESSMSNQIDSKWEQKYEGLQKVIEELATISEDLVKMMERNDLEIVKSRNTFHPARSSNKIAIVGIKDEILKIKDLLIGPKSELCIISVVGRQGLGKTTPAKIIYNDSDIASHFDIRAWATVSRMYYEQVLSHLLHSIRGLNQESSQESAEKLAENLYKFLKNKRCLIVLDDFWDRQIVLKVKSWFPHDSNGSRILLTSEWESAAMYDDPKCYIHKMRNPTEDEYWPLLRNLVFDKERCPHELVEIGTMIAMKCRGLPFLLTLIGGVLYKSERTQSYWRFIKPDRSKSLEEMAEDYLKDLIDRNLIMVREWSYRGEIKTCSIHGILRLFCQLRTRDIFCPDFENLPDVHVNLRHLSILREVKNQIPKFNLAFNLDLRIRSVTYFRNRLYDIHFLKSFRLLRILDALTIWFDEFPIEIVELETLRFFL